MADTPTQRTLRELRNRGLMCAIAEKFNPHVGPHGIRQDLFGIIDVVALDTQAGKIVGVQSTGQAFAQHEQKLLVEKREESMAWLQAGGVLVLMGWRKLKVKRGGKAMRWEPRVRVFTLDDFRADSPQPTGEESP